MVRFIKTIELVDREGECGSVFNACGLSWDRDKVLETGGKLKMATSR